MPTTINQNIIQAWKRKHVTSEIRLVPLRALLSIPIPQNRIHRPLQGANRNLEEASNKRCKIGATSNCQAIGQPNFGEQHCITKPFLCCQVQLTVHEDHQIPLPICHMHCESVPFIECSVQLNQQFMYKTGGTEALSTCTSSNEVYVQRVQTAAEACHSMTWSSHLQQRILTQIRPHKTITIQIKTILHWLVQSPIRLMLLELHQLVNLFYLR